MIEVQTGILVNPAWVVLVNKMGGGEQYKLHLIYHDATSTTINYEGDFVQRNKVYREFQKYGT